jgi:glycosyltransferase involved in cell wall biosynthesis
MATVIHLLPYDGIGGAEAAARSMAGRSWPGLDFRLDFIFPDVRSRAGRWRTFDPRPAFACLRRLRAAAPDLLVASLWRSCLVAIALKLLRPRTRLVVLVHNSADAHWLDFLATRAAVGLADAVWADSQASLARRFRRPPRAATTVIPFLTQRLAPLRDDAPPSPDFIYWGRLAAQKNLGRAIALFAAVRRARPQARFVVIGPDSGARAALLRQCQDLGCADAVRFVGPLAFDAIRDHARQATFYLQTSHYEGMAMAVVEAMQWGLVPVVTAVGEIARYCRDGENALIVGETDATAARVLALIDDADGWRRMQARARATWTDAPLYGEAVAAACHALLAANDARTPAP